VPSVNLTVPERQYPVGVTSATKSLPGNQTYSQLVLSAELAGWTDPATTRVRLAVDWSFDNEATWQEFGACDQVVPPPYNVKGGGTTTLCSCAFQEPAARNPTHMRGSVTIEGAAVTIGPITVSAS
jgi:hypothetical protein